MASVSGKAEKASKFEMLKLLENSRKERDEALQRENVLRERVRQNETRLRSTEGLKQKLKILTVDNKELRKQVKALRTEIGLESSPNFTGKTTKDIVNDLQEKERECNSLIEKTRKLSSTIDDLTAELSNVVTSKTLLEDQVQSLQQNLKDMTNNQRRLLKLWEDKKTQREQLILPAITQKFFTHKEVIWWRAAASIAWSLLTYHETLSVYSVIPTIACSKIALLGQLLQPRQVVNSFAHCLMGMIVGWCCAVAVGHRYETLGYPGKSSDGSVHPLDSIAGVVDLSLLYHLWISATFLLFTWYITLLLFRIFVTEVCGPIEVYSFPVQLTFTEDSHQCLPKVLTDNQPMILKVLKPTCRLLLTSSTEDLMSPRPAFPMKTPASVFAHSIAGGPHSPLTAPFTPDLDSPFASPALRRLTAPMDQCSPWYGSVQSPHIMRRAPKLWSTSTGKRRLKESSHATFSRPYV
ncbi:hypothetical protein XENOCAPTIV_004028 [Xenoophorus captivus]|uniref:Nucleoporin NDC1 n=1 Tax=Xenoophorus captivus TaxID=1517983 RepID=A0ABV0SAZ5_9TELE